MIDASEPFSEVQLVAMRTPYVIEPGLIVKADGVNDQSIAFILPD